MDSLLLDLCKHQAWADAEHWRAIDAHPAAREDPAIRTRLHHLHLVQRSFTWAVGDRSSGFTLMKSRPQDFASLDELKTFAREAHSDLDRFIANTPPDRWARNVTIPWFQNPPLSVSVSEALTQCAMHSQWHRGQNASRLRELGVTPPGVDLISWYWKGRPLPRWS